MASSSIGNGPSCFMTTECAIQYREPWLGARGLIYTQPLLSCTTWKEFIHSSEETAVIPKVLTVSATRNRNVNANSHIPCRSHAVQLRVCGIVSFPFDLHSAAVFDSHMPCRARAMPRPCRSERDFSRPLRSAAWAWNVWIGSGHPETPLGRPPRVQLLPATTRSSTKFVTRSIRSH
jgi:hypothetical protein